MSAITLFQTNEGKEFVMVSFAAAKDTGLNPDHASPSDVIIKELAVMLRVISKTANTRASASITNPKKRKTKLNNTGAFALVSRNNLSRSSWGNLIIESPCYQSFKARFLTVQYFHNCRRHIDPQHHIAPKS